MDAEAIKALRSEMRLPQHAFAEQIGVEQATVSRWETGRTQPSRAAARLLQRLARQVGRKARNGAARANGSAE